MLHTKILSLVAELISMCENIVRIVCRCSLLKCDDVNSKKMTNSCRWCELCDLYAEENVKHCVMKCPHSHKYTSDMLNEIDVIPNGSGAEFLRACPDILPVLSGASVPNFSCEDMCTIWRISGTYINNMHEARLQTRRGVG